VSLIIPGSRKLIKGVWLWEAGAMLGHLTPGVDVRGKKRGFKVNKAGEPLLGIV